MAPSERSPLLAPDNDNTSANETSPLLDSHTDRPADTDDQSPSDQPAGKKSSKWRWASITAGLVLATLVVVVLFVGFLVPGALQVYAEHAAIIEPTDLQVEAITADGVRARIQANFRMDASRVEDDTARRIGKFVGGIARKVESDETTINVYLPHYDNSLVGSARVPPVVINIADGQITTIDFVADLKPGNADDIKNIANEWLLGKIDQLKLTGTAAVTLKSGIIPLGTHDVVESMVFEANKLPALPEYNIDSINFHDVPIDRDHRKAIGANVSISLYNHYPIGVDIPPLAFDILVPNCDASEPYIEVAEAVTDVVQVRPDANISANAMGIISQIPDILTRSCPKSKLSPLDQFMQHYLHGEDAEIFVRGKQVEGSDTPDWMSDILKSIVVPLDLPGRSFGDAIRNFTASDIKFKLPGGFSDPGDGSDSPQVSGNIQVLAALPEGLNLDIGVDQIRSDADLLYKGSKLGELNLRQWEDAQSSKVVIEGESLLNITSHINNVPLTITNNSVFSEVVQKLVFLGQDVLLDVEASVDVKVGTVLGALALKGIPAKGKIPVKSLPKNTLNSLAPDVDDIQVTDTSETGVKLQARVNFTNPTPYTAVIPYFNIHIIHQGQVLGEAIARDVNLALGNNTDTIIEATWDPQTFGGTEALPVGRRLLSEYVSGKNTTLELRTHRRTIPALPEIGEAFSKVNVTVPTPRFDLPGDGSGGSDGSDEHLGFIRDATFHLFSSTATFLLASPLKQKTVYLGQIDATAYYNHTEPVGHIWHREAFPATPGLSQTPRLPVSWSTGHVGYDKLREALGGTLKLDAIANLTLSIGEWSENIRYEGHGIGASVRL